jgi:hypothetical protein
METKKRSVHGFPLFRGGEWPLFFYWIAEWYATAMSWARVRGIDSRHRLSASDKSRGQPRHKQGLKREIELRLMIAIAIPRSDGDSLNTL